MKLAHVPYKGAGPALNDLLGGHIGVLISAIPNAHSHILAGTIHALAVTGGKRAALIPAVPTFAEAGFPGYDVPLRWGLAAPAGTPRAIIEKLNQALNAALATEEVRRGSRSRAPRRSRARPRTTPPSSTARSPCGPIW